MKTDSIFRVAMCFLGHPVQFAAHFVQSDGLLAITDVGRQFLAVASAEVVLLYEWIIAEIDSVILDLLETFQVFAVEVFLAKLLLVVQLF